MVSLIDGERQWVKARRGIAATLAPRAWSFCSRTIRDPVLLLVPDAASDPVFSNSPLVIGPPGVRFYAGQSLSVDGVRIGTLCVFDIRPRELDAVGQEFLRKLGEKASVLLADRRQRVASFEQHRRLTEFSLVSGDWLWETDTDHRVVWMSSAYATDPVLPQPWSLEQPITDGQVLDARGSPVLPSMTLHHVFDLHHAFARAIVRGGTPESPSYVSYSAIVRRTPEGRWCGYRGIARDMRQAVQAQQELRNAADVLSELSEQIPGLIFQARLGADGQVTFPYVSERIRDICELTPHELRQEPRRVLSRLHPEDAERVLRSVRRSSLELTLWREAFRVVLPNQGERVLSGNANPKRFSDGSVLWHGLLTDVTDQIRASEEMHVLTIAQIASERAAEIRSEFMSRVSHELRTPLNAVLGFAQLLRLNGATQSREDTLAAATHITNAGGHLLSLVNDMLDLSSLDAGRLNLKLQPVAIEPILARCLTLIGPQAMASGKSFITDVAPGIPTAHADHRAISQVLFNLLGNAVKFSPSNTVVTVSLRYSAEQDNVCLEVSDQGPGIAADKLQSIFEPFTRIQQFAGSTAGTGLGLSISQKLMLAMAGHLTVDSVVGQGTTFKVSLPVDGDPDSHDFESEFAALVDEPRPVPVNGFDVLYIEDEPLNALLMEAIFNSCPPSLHLIVATDGASGLREAVLTRPNLVLLDMNLPDMGGVEVLRALRADGRTSHIPIIALSADALPEQVDFAKASGFDDYWTKPIDVRQIRDGLMKRLQGA